MQITVLCSFLLIALLQHVSGFNPGCSDPLGALQTCCLADSLCSSMLAPNEGSQLFETNLLNLVQSRVMDSDLTRVQLVLAMAQQLACLGNSTNCASAAAVLVLMNRCAYDEVLSGSLLECVDARSQGLLRSGFVDDPGTLMLIVLFTLLSAVSTFGNIYYLCHNSPRRSNDTKKIS